MSANLLTQLISLGLWIFALAGLEINPEQVAGETYTALVMKNWPLIGIVAVNLIGSVYKWVQTWKTNRPDFILFLRSPNWWVSFANIALSFVAMYGIVLPAGAAENIVNFIFTSDWIGLAGYIMPTLLGLLVNALTKKQADAKKAALARKGL